MLRSCMRKRAGVALSAVAVLALAAGAYAYFSAQGTGTGNATVGKTVNFKVAQTATTGGPLYPDGHIGEPNVVTDTYTVTNPGPGSQKLNQVVVSIANADGSAWSSGKCTASDFSVERQPVGQSFTDTRPARTWDGDVPAGSSLSEDVTVEMIDSRANQDDCQGVTVPLFFSAS